jgi:gamma-glutamylcyclotransferase (GGCT)/AIG2-like uncharacterized protein YtfP
MILFTYGTIPQFLITQKIPHKHIGTGIVQAIKLSDTKYPALIPPIGEYKYPISGQLIEIDKKYIHIVDDYEGDEYHREKVEITNDRDNKKISTYIYWYNLKSRSKPFCEQI